MTKMSDPNLSWLAPVPWDERVTELRDVLISDAFKTGPSSILHEIRRVRYTEDPPEIISLAVIANERLAIKRLREEDSYVNIGELAFLMARNRYLLGVQPHPAGSVRIDTYKFLTKVRRICGVYETLAWAFMFPFNHKDEVLDLITTANEHGVSLDAVARMVVVGCNQPAMLTNLIESGIDADIYASLHS
jgi:hypothetical protein